MGTIFNRGGRWYLSFKDATGKWRQMAAETTDETQAKRTLRKVEDGIAAQLATGSTGPLTLRQYGDKWIDNRRKLYEADGKQFRSWKTDQSRLRKHIVPRIGHMRLDEFRPRHLKEMFADLRRTTKLAPHTIRSVYGVLCAMFRDAAVDDLVEGTPCILTEAELGKDGYVDPVAHAEDRYSRADLARMVWDSRLEPDARVFAAIGAFAGLRLGAIAGLCWRDYANAEPLWRLTSKFAYDGLPTKTDNPSVIPVHPTLKGILDDWKAHGWAKMFGREPTDSDPIVPRPPRKGARANVGGPHTEKTGGMLMDRMLETLGITKPAKRTHALRSTHITLCDEDGADTFYVSKWTHPGKRKRDAFDVYRKGNWDRMCGEIQKLTLLKPFEGDKNPSGGNGLKVEAVGVEPVSRYQGAAANPTDHGVLATAAMATSGTVQHPASKTFWRSSIGFVQPAGLPPDAPDAVAADLQAALDAHYRGDDRRVIRRILVGVLAKLDE